MAFLDPVLNPVMQPLLNQSPFWAIVILAFVITLIITLVYKYATNQNEMKRLKDQQKEFQKKMKALRDNKDEMMKVQKEAMKINGQYMKHSFKATIITFLPIILIFGWMNAHLAYEPIYPGEQFSVTAELIPGVSEADLEIDEGLELLSEKKQAAVEDMVTWNLKGESGTHFFTVKTANSEAAKKVLITKEVMYEEPISLFDHSDVNQVTINYNKLKPLGRQSIFGWEPGWLGLYIILSIVFSIALRKVLKIY